jgi:hypothetical protein
MEVRAREPLGEGVTFGGRNARLAVNALDQPRPPILLPPFDGRARTPGE